ncbi:BppU family phage baseplate upper protein [Enterococcus avium]|uniref:BppU family phage baseplate upper protein n=1 Tax=Enterococcus avium TaxID=33945 RepID=UPI001F619E30|nr:BppU family phage baseplate upper protein [Enterococcus avium]
MIDVKIDLNKSLNSFSNRIKVRQGDVGEKMRITLTDNKFSLENQNNLQVKFEGNIRSGDYVEGIAFPYNDKAGEFVYQFKSEDVSIPGAYQRAFIRVYDESGNRISSEDIFVEVLKDADISNNQSKIYVSKLDELLEDFDDDFGEFLTGKEEDYSALDEKSKELNSELSDLKKGSNEIKNTQTEIIQSIEDNDLATKNDLETAKQESSANVIYQVIGKEKAEITFRLDAKSEFVKVSSVGYATLLSPTNVSWTPLTEEQLNNLSSLDGSLYSARDVAANYMKQLKYDCDILGFFKSLLGEKFFTIRGATTDSQKVEVLESLITDFTSNVYGYGSGGGINKLTHRNWNGTWTVSDSTAANEVTRIGQTIESTDTNWKKLINGGKISVLSNSEPTISPNYSTVNIDYLCLDVTIELSANEHFEYMIAANHGEKIATQEEAEAGTDNTKTMTPLRTAQQLEKKAVTIAGNQTIGGIKNFKDGLMINDVSLSTITRKVIYEADGVGGYFNAADKFTLGASGKIDKIVLLWSRVDDTAGTLLNYSWSQTVLSPDDLVVGNSYRIQMTTDNYKFVTFANESGNVTISGANENSVAPNRIYRIKRIIAYLKN